MHKTLDEAWELVESLKEKAQDLTWDRWQVTDDYENSDEGTANVITEQLRVEASQEQFKYFRKEFWNLDDGVREAIDYWVKDVDFFKVQFRDCFGRKEFDTEYGKEKDLSK